MIQRTHTRLDFGNAGNWNTIEARAREFVTKWNGETYERGESQSFWSDFLADLYDPLTMLPNLHRAHTDLDRAVDRLYRTKPFDDDANRVALLLRRYQVLVGG